MKFFNTIFNTILDFIFPRYCINCNKNDTFLCQECLNKIPISQEILNNNIYAIFDYQNIIIKKAIWMLKYKNKKEIAKILAPIIYERLLEELSEKISLNNFINPLLIPIPLSKKRLRIRSFNQSELLCKELKNIDTNKLFAFENKVLYKIKNTKNQVEIKNGKERLKNLENCFIVKNPEIIKNKNIILLDDVITTGATLKEARKTLIRAGAKKIIAFTVAH